LVTGVPSLLPCRFPHQCMRFPAAHETIVKSCWLSLLLVRACSICWPISPQRHQPFLRPWSLSLNLEKGFDFSVIWPSAEAVIVRLRTDSISIPASNLVLLVFETFPLVCLMRSRTIAGSHGLPLGPSSFRATRSLGQ
jgi:hypothetical protein